MPGWKKSKKSINVEGGNMRGGGIFFSKSISVTPRLLEMRVVDLKRDFCCKIKPENSLNISVSTKCNG